MSAFDCYRDSVFCVTCWLRFQSKDKDLLNQTLLIEEQRKTERYGDQNTEANHETSIAAVPEM